MTTYSNLETAVQMNHNRKEKYRRAYAADGNIVRVCGDAKSSYELVWGNSPVLVAAKAVGCRVVSQMIDGLDRVSTALADVTLATWLESRGLPAFDERAWMESQKPKVYASYAWLITIDFDPLTDAKEGTNGNAVGVMGPSNIDPELSFSLLNGQGRRFQLYDDDCNRLYEGRMLRIGEDALSDVSAGFEPLDDFGRGNAGCTQIWFERTGQPNCWERV